MKKTKQKNKPSRSLDSHQIMGAPDVAAIVAALHDKPRPPGANKKLYNDARKNKERFLDFQISTVQANSGVQQYGAGQKMEGRNAPVSNLPLTEAPGGLVAALPKRKTTQVISEREPLGPISGSTTFATSKVAVINPGLSDYFAWGSRIAGLYERYVIERCSLEYVPIVSAFNVDGSAGRIVLTADYDPTASEPATLKDAETNQPSVAGMPYGKLSLELDPVKCTPVRNTGKFVRTDVAAGDPSKLDAAVVFFSSEGCTSSDPIGELWINYTIRLIDPQLIAKGVKSSFRTATFFGVPNAGRNLVGGGVWQRGNLFTWDAGGTPSLLTPFTAFGCGDLPITKSTDAPGALVLAVPKGHYRFRSVIPFTQAGAVSQCVTQLVATCPTPVNGWEYQNFPASAATQHVAVGDVSVLDFFFCAQEDTYLSVYTATLQAAPGVISGASYGSLWFNSNVAMIQMELLD